MNATPSYLKLFASGELEKRAAAALEILKCCSLCPRECGIDRTAGEKGFCGTGRRSRIASYSLHFGEEAPLVGSGGSGTIFFGGCNLGCVFCQNYDISQNESAGIKAEPDELAGVMLSLQKKGAENINFVTPSHVVPQILESLVIAARHGLNLPLVYNTGSYDRVETLKLLDGIVDIYMPDVKIAPGETAGKYLRGAGDYPQRAKAAVLEMHRQVGDLALNGRGLAEKGLIIRHLVMPGDLAGTEEWLKFISEKVSKRSYVNIMDQYRPCGEAGGYPELDRSITVREYAIALSLARGFGLDRLDRGPRFLNLKST